MAVTQTWRTRDGRWVVDRVTGEPGVDWRIWDEGELAAEITGDRDALGRWLRHRQLTLHDLHPVPAEEADPWCE